MQVYKKTKIVFFSESCKPPVAWQYDSIKAKMPQAEIKHYWNIHETKAKDQWSCFRNWSWGAKVTIAFSNYKTEKHDLYLVVNVSWAKSSLTNIMSDHNWWMNGRTKAFILVLNDRQTDIFDLIDWLLDWLIDWIRAPGQGLNGYLIHVFKG